MPPTCGPGRAIRSAVGPCTAPVPGRSTHPVRFARTLLLARLTPSADTVGDALDNALAETTIGLYKTGCTRGGPPFRHGPVRSLADLEEISSTRVHWYNTARLMHRLGCRPPAGAEAEYYQQAKDAA